MKEKLAALFAACTEKEWLIFQFLLGSGFPEQEAMHACHNDLNFEDNTITVKENPELNFKPKDRKERMVPLPDSLMELLKARGKCRPKIGRSSQIEARSKL